MARPSRQKTEERNHHILEAAREVFLLNGFAGTSMEAIAKRAGIAKPTLYAYFPDKETLFRAAIDKLVMEFRKAFLAALNETEPTPIRVSNALFSKYGIVIDLLDKSPHAETLMTDKLLYAGKQFEELNLWLEEQISTALKSDGYAEPEKLGHILTSCTEGLFKFSKNREELIEEITLITNRILQK